jgi:hypothetical protein
VLLPPDVPVDFFTPEFYNGLTMKERARYANTGVAFPLADFFFDPAHEDWKTSSWRCKATMFWSSMISHPQRKLVHSLTPMPMMRKRWR